jgi:hypothetical protein
MDPSTFVSCNSDPAGIWWRLYGATWPAGRLDRQAAARAATSGRDGWGSSVWRYTDAWHGVSVTDRPMMGMHIIPHRVVLSRVLFCFVDGIAGTGWIWASCVNRLVWFDVDEMKVQG